MAVKQAWVMCNGQRVNATYNEDTQTWTAQITAPAQSSWSQPKRRGTKRSWIPRMKHMGMN